MKFSERLERLARDADRFGDQMNDLAWSIRSASEFAATGGFNDNARDAVVRLVTGMQWRDMCIVMWVKATGADHIVLAALVETIESRTPVEVVGQWLNEGVRR